MKYIISLFIMLVVCMTSCNVPPDNQPTVYIIGDSTVKNGRGEGDGGLWGWGDFLPQFLDTSKVQIENHALGGTSSRTFQSKGLWKPIKDSLKEGDFVLLQFGHNDNGPINDNFRARGTIKGTGTQSEEIDNILTGKHEVVHTYGWYLRKVIKETREKGAIPIVISPIPRNVWTQGTLTRNDQSYGGWARSVAQEEGVAFINLNRKMVNVLNSFGEEKVTGVYFYKRDHTHTSARGALLAASLIAEGISEKKNDLTQFLLENPITHLPEKKNIFLIGDSTVARNNDTLVGWGAVFEQHFDTTRVRVINKARGGRSSRTFRGEGLWKAVTDSLNEGDFVLIQFGHNDGGHIDQPKYRGSIRGMGEETQTVSFGKDSTEIVHTYGWYMKKYIEETRKKGATPIVLSMVPRNIWHGNSIERNDHDYAGLAKKAALETNTIFIDLNDSIALRYEQLGKDKVNAFFPKDHTHTNSKGAALSALIVAQSLEQIKRASIRDYIYLSQAQ